MMGITHAGYRFSGAPTHRRLMPSRRFHTLGLNLPLPDLQPGTWRLLLVVVFLGGYAAGFSYHLFLLSSGESPSLAGAIGYHATVLISFAALWLLMDSFLRHSEDGPVRILSTTVLAGIGYLTLASFIQLLGEPANLIDPSGSTLGIDYEVGVPVTMAAVIKLNMQSLLEVAFLFFVLQRLRRLVLFKRTRNSERNWRLMIGFFLLAALAAFMRPPTEDIGTLVGILMFPAVGLAVVNSFRLSWIVYLSFQKKMLAMGLSVALIVIVGLALGEGALPDVSDYVRYYSYPLSVFTLLTAIFAILYCLTTMLSLLFHLPTTSAFQRKTDEMAAMHSLTRLVSQAFDVDRLSQTIAATPVEAGAADLSWLMLPDPQKGALDPVVAASRGNGVERLYPELDLQALYEEASQKGGPLILHEAAGDHRVSTRNGAPVASLLAMPLLARDDVLGVLFSAREVEHGFEKDDIESIHVFAAQAALALDNARLFEQQLEKERLRRELDIAREVQQRLLPQEIPDLTGTSIAASSVPAQEVGGDYFDFLPIDEHRLAVIVADVAGKGTSGAFYMAVLQGAFRSLGRIKTDPAEFLSYANEALSSCLEKNAFISVIYGVLDTKAETFTLARAGHCPPALVNLRGETRLLRSPGIGLGLDTNGSVFRNSLKVESRTLDPGDVYVLFTDGVVESRNGEGEEYGYRRLLASIREHRPEEAPDLHDGLLEDLHVFLGEERYNDDLTLVVLKWHGLDLRRARAAEHAEEPSSLSKLP